MLETLVYWLSLDTDRDSDLHSHSVINGTEWVGFSGESQQFGRIEIRKKNQPFLHNVTIVKNNLTSACSYLYQQNKTKCSKKIKTIISFLFINS